MGNATLGLELEYCNFSVTLKTEKEIEEKDFKSKHIIVTDGDETAKALFSDLGKNGIRVTLDTRSQHGKLEGKIQLTVELVLDHSQFEILTTENKEIILSKPFSKHVSEFSKFITNESRKRTELKIKFEGNDNEYNLIIPEYKGNGFLMPHVTIPCPLCLIGYPADDGQTTGTGETIPDYSINYLQRILESLKSMLIVPGHILSNEDKNTIESHDPKQSFYAIPKTSFNTIFDMVRKKRPDFLLEKDTKYDYYITESITYNNLIDNINRNGDDLLKDCPIGIGSIGDALESISDVECPIFEFRHVRIFKLDQIESFEENLVGKLKEMYFNNLTPFVLF